MDGGGEDGGGGFFDVFPNGIPASALIVCESAWTGAEENLILLDITVSILGGADCGADEMMMRMNAPQRSMMGARGAAIQVKSAKVSPMTPSMMAS